MRIECSRFPDNCESGSSEPDWQELTRFSSEEPTPPSHETTKYHLRCFVVFLFLLITSITHAQSVGNIPFDSATDDPKFTLCDDKWVWQGYELKTKLDETAYTMTKEIKAKFITQPAWRNETAFVRVRFLVNCQGKSDRFRLLALDSNQNEKDIDPTLKKYIIQLARELQWPVRRAQQKTVDYYHYFSIKIADGQLTDVIL